MINNGVGGCGNDLAIDDIVFKTCGDFISIEDTFSNTSISVCPSEIPYSTTLEAIPDFSVFNSHFYQWQESIDGTNWSDIPSETNQTYQVNNILTTQYYRVKVAESPINLANDSCNTISEVFEIVVQPDIDPPASNGDVLFNCDINQAILSVSAPNGFTVNWYDSPTNGILLQANNTIYYSTSESGTFYAETVNVSTGCRSLTRTAVSISRIDPDSPISNGDVEFNCTTNQAELSVTIPNGVTVDWYDSPIDGNLLLADSSTFTTSIGNATFYAEALDNTTGCISLIRTPVSVSTVRPNAPISNGDVELNCTTNEAILTVTVPSGISVNWYDNNGTLLLSDSPVYSATSAGFYFAESIILSSGCTSISSVQIEVFNTSPNPPISEGDIGVSCNTSTGDLSVSVPFGVRVDWFDEATGGTLLASNSATYTTSTPGTYYAEAFDEVTNCKSTTRTAVSLIAGNEFPDVEDEFLTFCEDDTIILDANISNVTYLWSTGETTPQIEVDTPGTYTVVVTDSNNCSSTKTIELTQINNPVIESINSNGFQIEILTTIVGNFEYSLDGISYQANNIFEVESGLYTVYVRERDGCGQASLEYLHFVIPKFFTPNNDGQNDIFTLKGIESYPNSEVTIYDRYGKLIKRSVNQAFSWDGTFENQLLPTSDYWYVIQIENQIFRGHFTLKR
nr:T9SS type B sorting domain-containing protein [Hanstruepera flava]